jgi:2-phosphosulfolactate phosphatase
MPPHIDVHLLPSHFAPELLRGGTAVVVDVLRASTTILTALDNGAAAVRPCLTVDEALACRSEDARVLLGGERGGVRIDGFDLSNSPTDYSSPSVGDRVIGFTTTNGTRALHHSQRADEILIGAFANVTRLADHLNESDRPLHIVCAGTNGEVTGEDVLFAGCLIDRIVDRAEEPANVLTDTARMTLGWWRYEVSQRSLPEVLKSTRGGLNLMALAYESDIHLAAELDTHPVLAGFDQTTGLIKK